jgi:hypothetical protein
MVPSVAFGLLYPCMFKALKTSMLKRRLTLSVMGKTLKSEVSMVQLVGPVKKVWEKGFAVAGPLAPDG